MERAEKHTVFVLFFCFVCSSLHCLRYWSLSSNTISRASTSSYDYGSTISLRELNHQSGGYCFFISLLHSSLVHFLSFFFPFLFVCSLFISSVALVHQRFDHSVSQDIFQRHSLPHRAVPSVGRFLGSASFGYASLSQAFSLPVRPS